MTTKHLFAEKSLRDTLSRPLGDVLDEDGAVRLALETCGPVICVGDRVSSAFLRRGIRPKLVIFDERTRRSRTFAFPRALLAGYREYEAENPPGTLSDDAIATLKRLISQSGDFALRILGEEDLLGLPAIEMAPAGSLVFYGQPDAGIVAVKVNRDSKRMARSILEKSRVRRNGHQDN